MCRWTMRTTQLTCRRAEFGCFAGNSKRTQSTRNHRTGEWVGLGVEGLLTSDLFGLETTLDLATQALLDRRNELAALEEPSESQNEEMRQLTEKLRRRGFSDTVGDPIYSMVLRTLREKGLERTKQLTPEQRAQQESAVADAVTQFLAKKKST